MLNDLHLLQQQFYFSIICSKERTQASGNHVSTWWHLLKLADGQPSFSQEKQGGSHPHSSLPLPPPLSFSLDENKMWLFSLVIDVLSHSLKQCGLSKKDNVSSSLFLALIKYILVDIFSKLNSEQEDLVYFPLDLKDWWFIYRGKVGKRDWIREKWECNADHFLDCLHTDISSHLFIFLLV